MSAFEAIILGIIEGLTEFLPVSSTGHMILASAFMKISSDDEFAKTFEIAIQLGAIMAVAVMYFKRFIKSLDIYIKLAIAFVPTGIIGFMMYKIIKTYLFNPLTVSIALIIGGFVLIMLDKWSDRRRSKYEDLDKISVKDAFKIGLFQCISMIPGVSRAAATIFGGIFSGFNRRQAAEFSFLLAIPTMLAATGYDLLKTTAVIGNEEWKLLFIGGAVAFIFAIAAIKSFIAFIAKYGFTAFGYYRIVLGVVFLAVAYWMGLDMSV